LKRVFIGGCSRSGTTFLQELLANHSQVLTFPETGVFLKALGMRGRVLPWAFLGLTLGKERKALSRLVKEMELSKDALPPLPPRRFLLRNSVRDVVEFLDRLAADRGKSMWLEKTPRHVLHASRIQGLVPGSVFIHMVRDGRDVVASIVDRAQRFPESFHRQEGPSYGIRQWNRSMRATEVAMKDEGHLVVLYEELAHHPRKTLQSLCRVLELEFQEGMLHRDNSREFVTEREGWKERPEGPIQPAESKFTRLFDEGTRHRIEEGLDMASFRKIRDRIRGAPGSIWVSGSGSSGGLPGG